MSAALPPWGASDGDQFITYRGNPVAMADTPNSASSIVALLNAQDAGTSLAEQHFDQRLADVRAEFQRQLAAADRRTARAAGHGDQANEFARMSDALRLIDQHGCTHLTTGRCWEAGYTRGAPYSADAWCDACVAADALQEVAR